ncbi:hypothetical protein QWZ14_05520 [Paeniroseomonas aquatica]|uniref:Translation initiation factor IF-2 n=2 Tax=Paeniroseomonas aquatica TaxID=373043 RepID=A0ABT8A278_9PROT|nr:hypothetical protein [Paeniroseomonas aquatica]MDN3563835.1 hypothetical protein [Paeniroseomonas aquatica]
MNWNMLGVAGLTLALAACGGTSQDRGPDIAAARAAADTTPAAATGPRDMTLGTPPAAGPEVRPPARPLASAGPRTRRDRRMPTRRSTTEADRAYMGGGMPATDRASGASSGMSPGAAGTPAPAMMGTGSGSMTGTSAVPPASVAPTAGSPGAMAPAPQVTPIR